MQQDVQQRIKEAQSDAVANVLSSSLTQMRSTSKSSSISVLNVDYLFPSCSFLLVLVWICCPPVVQTRTIETHKVKQKCSCVIFGRQLQPLNTDVKPRLSIAEPNPAALRCPGPGPAPSPKVPLSTPLYCTVLVHIS